MSYIRWKVGQRLVCLKASDTSGDLSSPLLTGVVQEQNNGWVTVVCPMTWIIVSRYQEQFERDGWRLDTSTEVKAPPPTVTFSTTPTANPVGSK